MTKKKAVKNVVTVDLDAVHELVTEGKNIFLRPDAENALVALLSLRDKVEEAISNAKHILEEEGLKQNPNFSSIRSDKVRVFYRVFGAKYTVDDTHIADLPTALYKQKMTYSVNTKELEKFVEETGALPLGIIEKDLKKQITISLVTPKDKSHDDAK